jgi:RNA polymerase sigma factor (sigma-70 family)
MAQPAAPITSESLPPSDSELIAASRSGDRTAYAVLYQRHAASAHGLARSLLRGQSEADDAVAEAFARVLAQLRRGGGPSDAFRAYLLTTVRRVAYDRFRVEQRQVASGDLTEFDPGEPFVDPAVAGLERHIVARAYFSLPERWRAVLWHTAVEGARPAEIAELLGVTPNGAAALAYRAREGLRQAYLQAHLTGMVRQECRPVAARLGAYVRAGLSKREAAEVEAHMAGCTECGAAYAELADVNGGIRSVIGPIILGPAAAAALAAKGGLLGWLGGRILWLRHAPKQQQAAAGAGAVAVVAAIAGVVYALTSGTPVHHAAIAARHSVPVVVPAPHAPAPRPKPPAPVVAAPVVPVAAHAAGPRPAPVPRRRVAPKPAVLDASINPVGALLRGGTGIVTFTVTNTGQTVARTVAATIALPPGVSDLGGGSLGMAAPVLQAPGGWSCQPTATGVRCTHGPLDPGASTTSYLDVVVSSTAQLGTAPSIQASGGGARPVTAHAQAGVAASGLPARYAAIGRYSSVVGYGSFYRCHQSSTVSLALPGPVSWAGLYWSWAGPSDAAPITLTGPAAGSADLTPSDAGAQTIGDLTVHQAFANVSSLVTTGGDWTAQVNSDSSARYIGWTLVVVTARSSGPEGQIMVLDGTQLIVPWGSAFSVPIDGLLPSSVPAGIQAVTWQLPGGTGAAAFTEPPGRARSVIFAPGSESYVAGVLVVTAPPASAEYSERQPPASDFTNLEPRLRWPSGDAWPDPGSTDLGSSRAEGKDGEAWIAARCSLTRAMSLPTGRWPCTGPAAGSQSPGTTGACCSSSRASPGNAPSFPCCAATGTRRQSRGAGPTTTTP